MKQNLTAIAREAGSIAMRRFRTLTADNIALKGGSIKNLVTDVDREIEEAIISRISSVFPDHGIISEEAGHVKDSESASFIIDPLDGTVNYTHGLPHFAISIARTEAGEITHGLVFLPYFDELYYAEKGKGAWLNGRQIGVSKADSIDKAMLATGFACVRAGVKPDSVPIIAEVIYKVRALRRLGAATVDLCYVARGIYEGFWEMHLSPWDVAAGALIVKEAGGTVSGFGAVSDWLNGGAILATNGLLHEDIRKMVEAGLAKQLKTRKSK